MGIGQASLFADVSLSVIHNPPENTLAQLQLSVKLTEHYMAEYHLLFIARLLVMRV